MNVIGLTGGIGSGKSTFCKLMAEHGIATIDADVIARQVVEPGTEGLKKVVKEFGKKMLNDDGSLNRSALRKMVFKDPQDTTGRLKLESILHPLIHTETQKQIRHYQADTNYQAPYLIIAIPLLVEGMLKTGHKPHYIDEIWVLDCSEAVQIERASKRDGVDASQVKAIMASQATRNQRRQFADKLIHNQSGIAQLKQEVSKLL